MESPQEYVDLEHERIARTVKCKSCGAPKGIGCVVLDWVASDGKLMPVPRDRQHHSKRYKWANRIVQRFGADQGVQV